MGYKMLDKFSVLQGAEHVAKSFIEHKKELEKPREETREHKNEEKEMYQARNYER